MHFLTFTVIDWVDVFTRKEFKLEIVDSMNYCIREKGLIIYAWVIMSNHVHVIDRSAWFYRRGNIFAKLPAFGYIERTVQRRRNWYYLRYGRF